MLWVLVDALWFVAIVCGIGKAWELLARPSAWRGLTRASSVALIGLGIHLILDV
ncbi:hypothetical protein [Streptomyces zaomyceticus]|uniref:hypothetical protein n=1 Tax=Streptomyces zaomyceticus TaxID=68286 RepID=UPI003687C2D6